MRGRFYRCFKKAGVAAIGLSIASLCVLSAALAADAPSTSSGTTPQAAVQQESAIAKITPGLDTIYQEYQQYKAMQTGEPFRSEQMMTQVIGDRIAVDAVAVSDPQVLKAELETLGAVVTGVAGKMVSAELPIDRIPALSGLSSLLFARPVLYFSEAGSVTSQGDSALRADFARAQYNVDGTGSTVGIISNSFNCRNGADADVTSGDLPAGVQVVQEYDCTINPNVTDEGRALAQVVHDVAPGAKIQFYTGAGGEANMAQAITALRNAGSTIIVNDVGFLLEPFFQDSVVAQAVDQAVAAGVTYFDAAGNAGRKSYEAPFRPGTSFPSGRFGQAFLGGTAHDFDPGPGVDHFQKITCPEGQTLSLSLQWDNPFPSLGSPPPTANVDIYLLNDPPSGQPTVLARAQEFGDPVRILSAATPCASTVTRNLMIVLRNGTALSRIKYVLFANPRITIDEYDTRSPTIVGHRNAAGAIAVGASAYFLTPAFGRTPPVLNRLSSAGGVPILFWADGTPIPGGILRAKPEITAPDGGDTTFFGQDWEEPPNGYPNFFGTSAAAPHAAGVAALMRQANPNLTPAAVKKEMQATAIDMVDRLANDVPRDLNNVVPIGAGFDNDSGAGLINAQAAIEAGIRCYVDADGDIDKSDLSIISRARGKSPTPNDPRDANGDGKINPADVQTCIPRCMRPNCATQ